MPLPEYAVNQRRRKFGKVIPYAFQAFLIGKIIIDCFGIFFPFKKTFEANVCCKKLMHFPVSHNTGHTGKTRRVFVLDINAKSRILTLLIYVFYSFSVFFLTVCVHMNNCVN